MDNHNFIEVISVELSDDVNINGKLRKIIQFVIGEFEEIFSPPYPASTCQIKIKYRKEGPLIKTTEHSETCEVFLSVNNIYFDQLVFQLSHELGHVFCDPRRTNWFVESCCDLISLTLLEKISKIWDSKSPNLNLQHNYQPIFFKEYAENRKHESIKKIFDTPYLPNDKELKEWFKGISNSLDVASERDRNRIFAMMIEPIFKRSASNWNVFRYLGEASINPPKLPKEFLKEEFIFNKWREVMPDEQMQSLVEELHSLFPGIN